MLGEEEIEFCLNTYADAAEVAKNAGADGIEIHCAHETLAYSFLSPVTNRRTDQWGGGPQERVRFVLEALKRDSRACRRLARPGYTHCGVPSFARVATIIWKCARCSMPSAKPACSILSTSMPATAGARPPMCPNSYYAHAQFREFGKAAKADLAEMDPRPAVLFTGRINDPVLAEELVRDGICDLVGMVRAGIADPEFANKAREGRLSEIRRCISCTRCIDEASEPKTFPYTPTCSINPVIGNELRWEEQYQPADTPKHVVVVGGGLAGCEAARVAAMRGHKVTLLEQGKRLGGQLLIAAKAPGRDDFEDQVVFRGKRDGSVWESRYGSRPGRISTLSRRCRQTRWSSQRVRLPRVPKDIPGIDLPHVVQGWDVMQGKATTGDRVAIISMEDSYETPCVAEYLTERGKQVEVFSKSVHLGSDIARYSIGMVLKHMEQCGVKVHPNLMLNEVKPDSFELVSSWGDKTYREEGFDSVVLVCGSVPQHDLYDQLKARGGIGQVYVAGSAWLPRHLAEASSHGASIGLVI